MATNSDRVPCEIYSRVVGYLRPIQHWNPGKQAEHRARKFYTTTNPTPAPRADKDQQRDIV
jgi:hypothetical protein